MAFAIEVAFIDDPAFAANQVFILGFIVCLAKVNCWASASMAKVVADAVREAGLLF